MIDIVALKAALLQLAKEDPQFLRNLLDLLPKANDNATLNSSINPRLQNIVAEDFAEYETVFKKLA